MAITNYSELKTAIQTWLDRSDLSAQAADFIVLAESRLNRILPLRVQHVIVAVSAGVGATNITLPADFVEPYDLFLTSFGRRTRLSPRVTGTFEQGTVNGTPSAWSIYRQSIALDVPCDQTHTFEFHYRQSMALTDAAPTNWLLANHPDVYLFAALAEATFFIENPDFMAGVQARLNLAVKEVMDKEGRTPSVATLAVDAALAASDAFNVRAG